jgi:hypothetical protein
LQWTYHGCVLNWNKKATILGNMYDKSQFSQD